MATLFCDQETGKRTGNDKPVKCVGTLDLYQLSSLSNIDPADEHLADAKELGIGPLLVCADCGQIHKEHKTALRAKQQAARDAQAAAAEEARKAQVVAEREAAKRNIRDAAAAKAVLSAMKKGSPVGAWVPATHTDPLRGTKVLFNLDYTLIGEPVLNVRFSRPLPIQEPVTAAKRNEAAAAVRRQVEEQATALLSKVFAEPLKKAIDTAEIPHAVGTRLRDAQTRLVELEVQLGIKSELLNDKSWLARQVDSAIVERDLGVRVQSIIREIEETRRVIAASQPGADALQVSIHKAAGDALRLLNKMADESMAAIAAAVGPLFDQLETIASATAELSDSYGPQRQSVKMLAAAKTPAA